MEYTAVRGRTSADVYAGWYDLINIIVLINLVISAIAFLAFDVLTSGALLGALDENGDIDRTATAGVLIGIIVSGGVVVGTWVYQECLDRWESGQVVRNLLGTLCRRLDASPILSASESAANFYLGNSAELPYLPTFGTNYSAFYSQNSDRISALAAPIRSAILEAMVSFDAMQDIKRDLEEEGYRIDDEMQRNLVKEYLLHLSNVVFLSAGTVSRLESAKQTRWEPILASASLLMNKVGEPRLEASLAASIAPYFRSSPRTVSHQTPPELLPDSQAIQSRKDG